MAEWRSALPSGTGYGHFVGVAVDGWGCEGGDRLTRGFSGSFPYWRAARCRKRSPPLGGCGELLHFASAPGHREHGPAEVVEL